jgi:hypothetical protein
MARPTAGGKRDQDLGAFAAHPAAPGGRVPRQVGDVRAGGLEDAQAQQAEHCDQGEVTRTRGLAGRREQGLELQVSEPEGGRFRGDRRAADVLGG